MPGPGNIAVFALILLFAAFTNQIVEAKRGCTSYGHACFGGHGKRSDIARVNTDRAYERDAPFEASKRPRTIHNDVTAMFRKWLRSLQVARQDAALQDAE